MIKLTNLYNQLDIRPYNNFWGELKDQLLEQSNYQIWKQFRNELDNQFRNQLKTHLNQKLKND